MYGTDNSIAGMAMNQLHKMQAAQPSPEDMKRNVIRSAIYEGVEILNRLGTPVSSLVSSAILTKEEAWKILDLERFFELVEKAKAFGKPEDSVPAESQES